MAYTEEYIALLPGKEAKRQNITPINGKIPHPFVAKLVEKLNQGKSPNVAFVGDTGNGKSMKALRLVEILYDLNVFNGTFNPEENLVYGAENFLDVLVQQDTPEVESDDVKDDREAIIFDEAGVELNIAEYNSQNNKNIDKTLQVARAWNNLYIFIAPKIKDMDARLQQRLDYVVHAYAQGHATTNVVIEIADKMDGKVIFKKKIDDWHPDLPDEKLINAYREKEYEKKGETIQDMKDTLEEDEDDWGDSSLF